MKIVGICGSMRPFGSNSEWMVRKVLESAKNRGAEIELIILRDYKIRHCNGCDICFNTGKECVIKDDMNKIYPKLLEADAFVIGSPNYFKNVSGLMKVFMDRTNALVPKIGKKLIEKKVVGISVGAEELEDTAHCEEALKRFFNSHRLNIITLIKGRADAPGEIEKDKQIKKELENAGKKLVLDKILPKK